MDWIRKKYWKNHWGILDLENLQSRSHFMFCISESWRWLSSIIDALKMGKTVREKILKASLTLKMSISKWNFSFQHKRSELQPHIWRLHKILRHSFSAWSKINDVNANFFFLLFQGQYPVILCINFAFYKRSICTEISPHLKG